MCYSFRYKHRTKKSVSYGHLCANQFKIKIKSQLLPSPPSLTVVRTRGRGGGVGFEPDLAGVGNLNRKYQVFPTEYKCYIFQYGSV